MRIDVRIRFAIAVRRGLGLGFGLGFAITVRRFRLLPDFALHHFLWSRVS